MKLYTYIAILLGVTTLPPVQLFADSQSGVSAERQKPGAEYADGTKKRVYKKIAIEDLKEGSIEWAYYHAYRARWERDYVAIQQYATPAWVRNAKNDSEGNSKLMLELNSLTKPLYVADVGINDDWAYAYIGLMQNNQPGPLMSYYYFAKIGDRWVVSLMSEWKRSKINEVIEK